MKSQLQLLRERVDAATENRTRGVPFDVPAGAQTFCVTSGKGGVGKTSFSVNFALSLAGMNKKVVVIDGDFGFSNVNLMLGHTAKYTLEHVLSGEKHLTEVMQETYPNMWYISGGSGVSELIEMGGTQLQRILEQLSVLEQQMDYIIFDTGAGINDNILRMIDASDRTILVTTPEPTSVLDSYVVLKSAAELEDRPQVSVLINKANNEHEARSTFQSLATVAGQNLGYHIHMLGYVPADSRITKSIKAMVPFMVQYPASGTSVQLKRIAEEIAGQSRQGSETRGGMRGFFQRLVSGRRRRR